VLLFGLVAVRARVAPLTLAEVVVPVTALVAGGASAVAGADGAAVAGAAVATGAATGAGAGAGAGPGVATGVGGAAGVAGVPKPCGVQAHAIPAPATATPRTDRTIKNMKRACRCTEPLLGLVFRSI